MSKLNRHIDLIERIPNKFLRDKTIEVLSINTDSNFQIDEHDETIIIKTKGALELNTKYDIGELHENKTKLEILDYTGNYFKKQGNEVYLVDYSHKVDTWTLKFKLYEDDFGSNLD